VVTATPPIGLCRARHGKRRYGRGVHPLKLTWHAPVFALFMGCVCRFQRRTFATLAAIESGAASADSAGGESATPQRPRRDKM
jgi:hypothetical protein